MTDNEIIKALELAESNHRFHIPQTLLDQTIALIKRQKAEIEKIFEWIENNASNLNFVTGNFEINLGEYLELKKKYTEGKQ